MSNSSISSNPRVGAALGLPGNVVLQVVALGDLNGNLLRTSDLGDGTSSLHGVAMPITYVSQAQATSNLGASFATSAIEAIAVDITLTSFTGGSSPSVTFFVDRLGNDSVWYRTWTSSALTTATTVSQVIGPFPAATGITTAVLTGTARFGWSSSGSPTAITFSASVVGRI
ncbi:hypothetical protein ACWGCW_01010 [Streptomyces sp. NPDC054933]